MKTSDAGQAISRHQRVLTHLALLALCVPFSLPLVWMLSTSLKTDAQIFPRDQTVAPFSIEQLVPSPVNWDNYPEALKTVPFGTYFRNTLILCILNVIGAVFSSAVVAYGFARLEFPGKRFLFLLMISTMALPHQVTMIPVFTLFRMLGWYGTLLPLFAPSFFGNAFFVFLLHQFMRTIPQELMDAGRIDGASDGRIFFQIILPLTRPALATCALFQFLRTWNDFFGPLIYVNDPSKYTVAYGLQQFLSSYGSEWAQLMAGATIFTVPIIVLFFLAQRTFIQGISTTGTKA